MKNIIYTTVLSCLLLGCSSYKFTLTEEEKNDPVYVAVQDFLRDPKFLKDSTVFIITKYDLNDSIVGIEVFANSDPYPLEEKDRKEMIGTTSNYFPSKYIEVDNRLFIWSDSTQVIDEELFNKLDSYDLVEYDMTKWMMITGGSKVFNYFLCKTNPLIFKRIISRRVLFYLDIPKLKCN